MDTRVSDPLSGGHGLTSSPHPPAVTERYSQSKLICLLTFCLLINSSERKQCVNFQVEI